jgi:hypothetical protein
VDLRLDGHVNVSTTHIVNARQQLHAVGWLVFREDLTQYMETRTSSNDRC